MSGAPDDPNLLSVAASISAGEQVEWARLKHGAGEAELRELRVIEEIARFHRSPVEGAPAAPDLRRWGHFEIVEQVGAGAFGAVYRAADEKLQREVALKLLPASDAYGIDTSRVLKEARLLARVRHGNVVAVYGADELEQRVGIWMEFVRGHTLEALLQTHGQMSAREAALIGLDLCRALAAVHRAGLIHGDVKAHNVMREEGGRIVLMDFGTGKDIENDRAAAQLGDLAGTPLYLAPEVFEWRPRTKAVDIYALGVLLYHLVTRGYPVAGATVAAVTEAHRRGERSGLRDARPDLPDEFVQIVDRALATDPGRRWPTAGAFEADLARFLGARPEMPEGRRTKVWAVTAAVVVAVALVGATSYWIVDRNRSAPAASVAAPPTSGQLPAVAASVPGAYTIQAALYRERDGAEERLAPNASLRPGDKLSLELRSSTAAHVYVVNEDDRGESYLLFPLPGQKLTNPLPAGLPARLPGDREGTTLYWQVTSAGGREHFLIFASPEPVTAFERTFAGLRQPALQAAVRSAPLPGDLVGQLRSVGGLVSQPARPTTGSRLSELFTVELAQSVETTRGLWVRQITLNNPAR